MEHTKEPWGWEHLLSTSDPLTLIDNNGKTIGRIIAKEDARRIAVAVNACAGIPTDMLEEGIIGKAMADFEMMQEAEKIMLKTLAELRLENLRLGIENQRIKETACVAKEDSDIRRGPVNATVLQALIEVTNALQDASGLTDNEGGDYTQEYAPVIEEARRVIEQAEREYKPGLFIGTETGIEDIDKAPDEPDYDNQAKDYDEDRRWEGSPTEYDM